MSSKGRFIEAAFYLEDREFVVRLMNEFKVFLFVGAALVLSGCDTAYYGAMEQFGVHKRDLLRDRVEEAMEAQTDAKEEFQSAFERFSSVVDVKGSELQKVYNSLNDAYEDAESKASAVSDRIDSVEDVSEDLFAEWESEATQISNAGMRRASQRELASSKRRYADLMKSMRRAESRMAPVLTAFRDQVLFLKHNLNAQAISSLKSELTNIETDVARLIKEMEASIERSEAYIREYANGANS